MLLYSVFNVRTQALETRSTAAPLLDINMPYCSVSCNVFLSSQFLQISREPHGYIYMYARARGRASIYLYKC
nr:MAG TPA: hypothetical protein [Bacteriophage sp.]